MEKIDSLIKELQKALVQQEALAIDTGEKEDHELATVLKEQLNSAEEVKRLIIELNL